MPSNNALQQDRKSKEKGIQESGKSKENRTKHAK